MRKFLFTGIVLLCAVSARAQYNLSISAENYSELSGATELPMKWYDTLGQYSYIYLENEEFRFGANSYLFDNENPLGVSKWGNLKITGAKSSVIIDPFFTYLDSVHNTKVFYSIEGAPGEKVVKIEWRNIGFPYCEKEFFANFQIWLFQKNGALEMHYGPSSIACDSVFLGGTGPNVGIFEGSPAFDKIFWIYWLKDDPAQPTIIHNNFLPLQGVPANGQVYRFTSLSSDVEEENLYQEGNIFSISSDGKIFFREKFSSAASVKIFSYTGVLMLEEKLPEGASELDVQPLAGGVYFMEYSANGKIFRNTFCKF